MRLKFIIGILAFFLLVVGTASAEITSYVMDEENDEYGYGIDIKVRVDYDSTANTMSFTVIEPKNQLYQEEGYTISKVNLVSIWIKTDSGNVQVLSPAGWGTPSSNQGSIGNFGKFDTEIRTDNENIKFEGPVTIQLLNGVTLDSLREDAGSDYVVAAHVAFEKSGEKGVVGCSGKVRGYTPIPEFPTIALPIAAILGLMFVFGRRKQK